MSYQVIARKYRPQRFDDVVGQEHVTQTLANAIRSGRIAHAYLFCGPRGTGKTTVARIFAKALNCTGGPKADFDDADPRCREIAEGRSLDVLEIDGASNNGVEQVRELRETARFAPASSKFKIYIIDEVHMLSTAAFNALLKTLEEPPAHVKFLFATTDPEKVLPTILSRCQRFDLRRIPTALIVKHLATIAAQEGVTLGDAALHAIARGADGGMRDAESTLDQLISFCGNRIEESDVLSMFGLAARAQLLELSGAVLRNDPSSVLRALEELVRNGKDLGRLLNDLLHHFRNLMVYQVTGGDLALLEVSEAEGVELQAQAAMAPVDAVGRVLEVLSAAEGRMRDAAARKIFLEVTLMKAMQARNAVSLDAVLKQLHQLRQETGGDASSAGPRSAGAASTPPAPAARPPVPVAPSSSASASSPAPALATPAAASKVVPTSLPPAAEPKPSAPSAPLPPTSESAAVGADPGELWAQVVASAGPLVRSALQAGTAMGLEKGVLTVGYPPSMDAQRAMAESERTRKGIETKLAELGRPGTVRFVRIPEPPGGAASVPSENASIPATPRS
ncbi:MAG: DNA polymerase III subunit gamma/tau, partial [Verrucomicrobiales bacterium]|nr:DNA polymerase III subunit gamma/tau [Verrucomicrobiales bacterium]